MLTIAGSGYNKRNPLRGSIRGLKFDPLTKPLIYMDERSKVGAVGGNRALVAACCNGSQLATISL